MLEGKRVIAIRDKARRGWSVRAIVRALGVSRNTVRRYLRQPVQAGEQTRPRARRLHDELRSETRRLFCSSTHPNATAVHRLLTTRGVSVSERTVRRAVADLRDVAPRHPAPLADSESAAWELELAQQIAHHRRTPDPDELESDLTLQLAKLQHLRRQVNNWRAFLTTALNRRADNWLRNIRRQEQPLISLDAPFRAAPEEDLTALDIFPHRELGPGERLAIERVRADLNAHLRRVWDALVQEHFSQTRAAKRLGVHRNTIRNALRQIRRVLKRHGF